MDRLRTISSTISTALILAWLWAGAASPVAAASTNALLPDLAQTEAAAERNQAMSETQAWPTFPDGPSLRPGASDPRTPALRARLSATDDFRGGAVAAAGVYDLRLVDAVRRFQARHGLVVDGIVGPKTRAALNLSPARRAAMLTLNLERLRALLPWPERFVLVQVPAFEAVAVEHGTVALRSRAIVGRTTRQTPNLRSAINELIFNPYWTVPVKIARRDIAPKVRADPDYLATRGIRVFSDWGPGAPEIDPASVNWNAVPASIKLRQDPGPKNALGQVKFLFPNRYDVYLHDTPDRHLFERLPRTFSSGCVRLARALDLAAWLLANDAGWTAEEVHGVAAQGRRMPVKLDAPVPVIFTYLTAWAGSDGVAQFRDDVYRRDRMPDPAVAAAGPDACHVDDPALRP